MHSLRGDPLTWLNRPRRRRGPLRSAPGAQSRIGVQSSRLLGQRLPCPGGRGSSVAVRACRRERTNASMPKTTNSAAPETRPDTSRPVEAKVPLAGTTAAAVVMDVEAQAWPGLSVQGSVITVGPEPGGAVTLIRFVNVPVAPARDRANQREGRRRPRRHQGHGPEQGDEVECARAVRVRRRQRKGRMAASLGPRRRWHRRCRCWPP